ncbi:unnamed protein product, partial [Staurois parvus]
HLATPPGSLAAPPPRRLIGHRNCSSGVLAHRRPITGEEVELGEEVRGAEPRAAAQRYSQRSDRGSCGASEEECGQRRKRLS